MWKLKKDAAGNVILNADGMPIYIKDDGTEIAPNVEAMTSTIGRLGNEAKQHREARQAAEERLSAFGDADPTKVKAALDVVGKLDQKQLIDAGKVDEVRAAVEKEWREKYVSLETAYNGMQKTVAEKTLNNAFANSTYIRENLIVSPIVAEKIFGSNFEVDKEGNLVAKLNGNQLYSEKNPGKLADFDEAIGMILKQDETAKSIMKGSGSKGSGSTAPGSAPAARTITRSEFGALPPAQQASIAAEARSGTAKIVD